MTSAALIPDRRRKHFPRNGGPRPTDADRNQGRRGIEAARAVLRAIEPSEPRERRVVRRLTPEQIVRARAGIARARNALTETDTKTAADAA